METFRKPDAYKSINSSSVILKEEEDDFIDDISNAFYDCVDNLKKLLTNGFL